MKQAQWVEIMVQSIVDKSESGGKVAKRMKDFFDKKKPALGSPEFEISRKLSDAEGQLGKAYKNAVEALREIEKLTPLE